MRYFGREMHSSGEVAEGIGVVKFRFAGNSWLLTFCRAGSDEKNDKWRFVTSETYQTSDIE